MPGEMKYIKAHEIPCGVCWKVLTLYTDFFKSELAKAGWRKNPKLNKSTEFICKECFIKMTVDRLKGVKPFDGNNEISMGSETFATAATTICTTANFNTLYGISVVNPSQIVAKITG